MKKILAFIQGLYYAATGIWPLVDIESFIYVTGPKTDIWLVRTVGVLVLVIGASLLAASGKKAINSPVLVLAIGSCIGFAAIDITYVLNDTISEIYLLDAGGQFLLLILWMIALLFIGKRKKDNLNW